ncbi:lipid II flippase Amj family protein [Croceicoccus bisphenolivorans]|uniref:lipid II flippase Amj family protein n=1 Tax=Croceicoccus bisphenolivorans TaxID=1783232 RepID=UPI00083065DE|nr:lipid II flippase Amj family protein [Croceicoccus bisphenolivorans]
MDSNLVILCILTGVINLIGALAYAARIAGVRTRRIAMSFALFNILVLVSRLSNSFLAPLLAKRVENGIVSRGAEHLTADFRWLMASAAIAILIGILLVPTAQRLFSTAIGSMKARPSLAAIARRTISPAGLRELRRSAALPSTRHVRGWPRPARALWPVLIANALAQALLIVGVLAALYAGYLEPTYRVTASQLSAVINGVATILLFAFIDPYLSIMTDDVIDGQLSEHDFRQTVVWISLSRLAGSLFAQAIFLPSAALIVWLARVL